MTANTVHNSDDTDKHELLNQDRKDDWNDDNIVVNSQRLKVEAPSFLRLFVLRRILEKHLANYNHKEKDKEIQELANVFGYSGVPHTQDKVIEIVTRLIEDGITIYMNKWYNEKEQFGIIEMIFNQIISKKFAKEYNDSNTYGGNNCNSLIFNSSDLMCNIFHYLTYGNRFNGDLLSCSLVSSHWLYHVWNINSVYFVNLTDLVESTLIFSKQQSQIKNNYNVARMWQRIVNARSIYLDGGSSVDPLVLDKISMLGNVVTLNATFTIPSIGILKVLMLRCREKIQNCKIQIIADGSDPIMAMPSKQENELSPLYLVNAQYISIDDLYFYRIWTNKCRQLVLRLKNMSKQWLEFVIQHCDCSNVTGLQLCLVRDNGIEIDEMILTRFASKFSGLQYLTVVFSDMFDDFDHSILLLWELLTPMIKKHNGTIEMILDDFRELSQDASSLLQDTIEKQHLKIDKITIKRENGEMTGHVIDDWKIGGIIGRGGFGLIRVSGGAYHNHDKSSS